MWAMQLPLPLPLAPMLAKAVASLPEPDAIEGGWSYEPKWDGFRCLVARDGDGVELFSRGKKPLTRYFPELVAIALEQLPAQCIVDGEIVVRAGEPGAQHLAWEALSQRIHPAQSRIDKLSSETPAELVFFDLLVIDGRDVTGQGYLERRALLEQMVAGLDHRSLHLSRTTRDAAEAHDWFERFEGAGLDGVVCKANTGAYQQDKRAMLKVKHKRTAEAVVTGYRVHTSGSGVGSLLLGMYHEGQLVPVGGIGAFTQAMRACLVDELAPLVVRDDDGEVVHQERSRSRFSGGKDASVIALEPSLVVEVAFDQLEGLRFRHAAQFLRWRPDREPASCLLDQVDRPIAYDLDEVLQG